MEVVGRTVAIEASGLGKVYDGVTAIDGLSFQVFAGEIFGGERLRQYRV